MASKHLNTDWLSCEQAAILLGCTDSRIRQLLRSGGIAGRKLNGRAWLVDGASVAEYGRKPRGAGRPRGGQNTKGRTNGSK